MVESSPVEIERGPGAVFGGLVGGVQGERRNQGRDTPSVHSPVNPKTE